VTTRKATLSSQFRSDQFYPVDTNRKHISRYQQQQPHQQ